MADASPNSPQVDETILHAACVALEERAVLITGRSGSGKSALALSLMAFGAALVADDRTVVTFKKGRLSASSPPTIKGLIEARGVGILRARALANAEVVLAIDMDRVETDRLPHQYHVTILGVELPLCLKVEAAHFAPAILQYLREGRTA